MTAQEQIDRLLLRLEDPGLTPAEVEQLEGRIKILEGQKQ